jgi:long-chain acyl-CoA synthetase
VISERIESIAAEQPDRPALIDGPTTVSYGELIRRRTVLVDILHRRFRVAEGDIVAVSLPNCWESAAYFLAAAKLGAIFLPLNTQWRTSEAKWLAERLPIRALVTCLKLRGPWDEVRDALPPERILSIDESEMESGWSGPALEPPHPCGPRRFEEQSALYLTTSGSTGRPRLVPRSHRNLIAGAQAVGEALGINRGQRFLSVIPFHHANGFSNCLFLPLMYGATVVVMKRFLPTAVAETVAQQRIQVLIGSPVVYSLLSDGIADPLAFHGVRISVSSGAPLPSVLAQLWKDRFGLRIRQLYGSSETGTISIEREADPEEPGSMGRPLPSVEVRVLGVDDAPLSANHVGEVAVRSPAMMAGYVGEQELNRQAFVGGFLRTGDLGRLTDDGLLVFEGRRKRLINAGGVKVDPVAVEEVLRTFPEVQECRVLPGRDAKDMEILKALIVMHPGCSASYSEIMKHCRKYLAEYKIPRRIEIVDAIPVDLAGKSPVEWSSR